MSTFKKYINYLYNNAEQSGEQDVIKALKISKADTLLDVGCWDGVNTMKWKKASGAKKVFGIELVPEAAKLAEKKGIVVHKNDVNKRWTVESNSVDCVVSNLLIEHLTDVDNFISETHRVLKKGGYTVVATNNLSSWHNIISLLFGWSPFDLSNTSIKSWSVGNPFSLHRKEDRTYPNTFTHKCVYTERWLKDWYQLYGFNQIKSYGSGYYPLPSFIGKLDKTHAALMTLVFKK